MIRLFVCSFVRSFVRSSFIHSGTSYNHQGWSVVVQYFLKIRHFGPVGLSSVRVHSRNVL